MEFGYFPFEELPPVTTQVTEEIIICEVAKGEINLKHQDPVNNDLEISLPLKLEKKKKLQKSNPHIKHLKSQWKKNDLDRNVYTMEDEILKRKLILNRLL